jgi:hypothetical protein
VDGVRFSLEVLSTLRQAGADMAIEKDIVHGRPVVVMYLNDRFEPVDKDVATHAKIVFTDDEGGMIFATVVPSEHETARAS